MDCGRDWGGRGPPGKAGVDNSRFCDLFRWRGRRAPRYCGKQDEKQGQPGADKAALRPNGCRR